jgi:hypothetical protein
VAARRVRVRPAVLDRLTGRIWREAKPRIATLSRLAHFPGPGSSVCTMRTRRSAVAGLDQRRLAIERHGLKRECNAALIVVSR